MYKKIVKDGYIVCVGKTVCGETITEEEYNSIMTAMQNRPAENDGLGYRLRDDITWESFEIISNVPTEEQHSSYTEEELLAMSNAELEQILYRYGRTAYMNKANMVELIIRLQSESNSL